MTTRSDMIELAQRRNELRARQARAAAKQKDVDTSQLYLSTREISERMGVSQEAVRWAMQDFEPVLVPGIRNDGSGLHARAYGYTEKQVKAAFSGRKVRETH